MNKSINEKIYEENDELKEFLEIEQSLNIHKGDEKKINKTIDKVKKIEQSQKQIRTPKRLKSPKNNESKGDIKETKDHNKRAPEISIASKFRNIKEQTNIAQSEKCSLNKGFQFEVQKEENKEINKPKKINSNYQKQGLISKGDKHNNEVDGNKDLKILQSSLNTKEKLLISQECRIERIKNYMKILLINSAESLSNKTILRILFISWRDYIKYKEQCSMILRTKTMKRNQYLCFQGWRNLIQRKKLNKLKGFNIIASVIKHKYIKSLRILKEHSVEINNAQFGYLLAVLISSSKHLLKRTKKSVIKKLIKEIKSKHKKESIKTFQFNL